MYLNTALLKKRFTDLSKTTNLPGKTESDDNNLNSPNNNKTTLKDLPNPKAKVKQRITSRKIGRKTALIKRMEKNLNYASSLEKITYLNLQKCNESSTVNIDKPKVENTSYQKKDPFYTKRVQFSDFHIILRLVEDNTKLTEGTRNLNKSKMRDIKTNLSAQSSNTARRSMQANRQTKRFNKVGKVQQRFRPNQHVQKLARPISFRLTAFQRNQELLSNLNLLNQKSENKCQSNIYHHNMEEMHCNSNMKEMHCYSNMKEMHCNSNIKEMHCNSNDKKVTIALDVRDFSLRQIVIVFHPGKLIITARKNIKTQYGYNLHQIKRTYFLPIDVKRFKIFTKMINNVMLIIHCVPDISSEAV